jgi:transposase InsO family protein
MSSSRSPSRSSVCKRTLARQFLAYAVRDRLFALRIKHRPIPPRTPHLNGKVERAQKTVLDEFYATTELTSPTLASDLEDWLDDYNYRRVHGSLGVAPIDRWAALEEEIPSWDDVLAAFDLKKEANYVEWLTLKRLRTRASKK